MSERCWAAAFLHGKATARLGLDGLFQSSFVGLDLALVQMVVPGELENQRGYQNDCQGYGGAVELLDHDVQGQRHQGNLPDDADHDVEHIEEEVRVLLEAGLFGKDLLQHRSPEAPWPHPAIEDRK